MHVATVSSLKGSLDNKHQERPRTGTRLGELYELFKANEGIPIVGVTFTGSSYTRIGQLQDFYGLDIRCIHRGGHQRGKSTWVLAGEWFGSEYVDYIARRIEQHEASQGEMA
jgi:hypothetical protein